MCSMGADVSPTSELSGEKRPSLNKEESEMVRNILVPRFISKNMLVGTLMPE